MVPGVKDKMRRSRTELSMVIKSKPHRSLKCQDCSISSMWWIHTQIYTGDKTVQNLLLSPPPLPPSIGPSIHPSIHPSLCISPPSRARTNTEYKQDWRNLNKIGVLLSNSFTHPCPSICHSPTISLLSLFSFQKPTTHHLSLCGLIPHLKKAVINQAPPGPLHPFD